jgi:hypothetical protein
MIRTPYISNRPFVLGSHVENHNGVPETKEALGSKWGPQVHDRHDAASPIEAISTIKVFYLFVTLLWESRGTIC